MRAKYTGCIGTHAHDCQVTPLLCLSDVIGLNCILAYLGTSGRFFKIKKNSGEQEKESIIRVRAGKENPSLGITICHHSASLEVPNGDPRDGFFYPTLRLTIDSYIITSRQHVFINIFNISVRNLHSLLFHFPDKWWDKIAYCKLFYICNELLKSVSTLFYFLFSALCRWRLVRIYIAAIYCVRFVYASRMGLIERKPAFGVSHKASCKAVSPATETS